MKRIILDTNFIIDSLKFWVDIIEGLKQIADFEYKVFILDKTLEELEKIIKEQRGKDKELAQLALKLIKIKNIETLKTESIKNADNCLIELANSPDTIIATHDRALKAKIKEKNRPLLIIRQKNYLKII